jgi:uncharacterized protein YdcH (DUF465 family)
MLGEHHDLASEFPELKDKMHSMKMENAHFAKLFDAYHHVNRDVIRMEQEAQVVSDETLEDAKKTRLKLKDELYAMLKA